MNGKEVLHDQFKRESTITNTASLSNGMYFLMIENNESIIGRKKIMIAH